MMKRLLSLFFLLCTYFLFAAEIESEQKIRHFIDEFYINFLNETLKIDELDAFTVKNLVRNIQYFRTINPDAYEDFYPLLLQQYLNTISTESINQMTVHELNELIKDIIDYRTAIKDLTAYRDLENAIQKRAVVLKKGFFIISIDEIKKIGACSLFEQLVTNPLITVFKNGKPEEERLNTKEVACVNSYVPSKKVSGIPNRILIQLHAINQNKLTGEHCPGFAVRSAVIVQKFVQTGSVELLKQLYDLKLAKEFIDKIGCPKVADKEYIIEKVINNSIVKNMGLNPDFISVIESVKILGIPDYPLQKQLHEGLQQPYFFHALIVGNEEERIRAHWFCFCIIKAQNVVQYIVIDTLPNYHLDPKPYIDKPQNSLQYDRIRYLIDMLEQGSSPISYATGEEETKEEEFEFEPF